MESYHRGHLGVHAEPGTVLGPDFYEQYLVVGDCTHNSDKACIWSATPEDIVAVYHRDPRSVTEHKLRKVKLR